MPHPLFSLDAIEDEAKPIVESSSTEIQGLSFFDDFGASGVRRQSGIIDAEFLPALRGRKGVKVYREMEANSHTIAALLFAIRQLIKSVTWTVEADDTSEEQEAAKVFLEECLEDMSHSWESCLDEILSMLPYGWAYMEVTYKERRGPWEKEAKHKSKFTDGKIGWRKIQLRSQETMQRWVFDDEGEVKGLIQIAPPKWKQVYIPIEKALHFRYGSGVSPEGISMLRPMYPLYMACKRLLEIALIGMERDLAGMPVAYVPDRFMAAPKNSKEGKAFEQFKKMVKSIRRDEHDGLVLPLKYDRNTKQPEFKFELMASGGSRQANPIEVIESFEAGILRTVMADWMKLGQSGGGSYSMHISQTAIFRQGLESIANSIADVFNRHAIPKLFELNNMKLDQLPKLVPEAVDPPPLDQLAAAMSQFASMGMEWFPDADLEEYIRKIAHLPALPEDAHEARHEMTKDRVEGSLMGSKAQLQGQQQQQDLIEQGMSPAQAEQHLATPAEETAQIQQQQQLQLQEQQMGLQQAQQEQQMGMQQEQQAQQMEMQRQQQAEQRAMQQEQRMQEQEDYPFRLQQQRDQLEMQMAQLELKERELALKEREQYGPPVDDEEPDDEEYDNEGSDDEEYVEEEPELDEETLAILRRLLG